MSVSMLPSLSLFDSIRSSFFFLLLLELRNFVTTLDLSAVDVLDLSAVDDLDLSVVDDLGLLSAVDDLDLSAVDDLGLLSAVDDLDLTAVDDLDFSAVNGLGLSPFNGDLIGDKLVL